MESEMFEVLLCTWQYGTESKYCVPFCREESESKEEMKRCSQKGTAAYRPAFIMSAQVHLAYPQLPMIFLAAREERLILNHVAN